MTPGPTIIKKCSACSKPIAQHTIGSGNTFGATFWTDGKREAPMLPDQPWLIMCPHCHAPLWLDELATLGEVEVFGNRSGEFKYVPEYRTPVPDDYFALLVTGVADPKKERYVRVRAWWAGNDDRRTDVAELPMSPREKANVTGLAHTLDQSDPSDLVMKAEVMRELGRFDDAISLLGKSVDENNAQAVEIIKGLARKRDPYVREMHFK